MVFFLQLYMLNSARLEEYWETELFSVYPFVACQLQALLSRWDFSHAFSEKLEHCYLEVGSYCISQTLLKLTAICLPPTPKC